MTDDEYYQSGFKENFKQNSDMFVNNLSTIVSEYGKVLLQLVILMFNVQPEMTLIKL